VGPLFHPLVCSVRKPIFQPLREAEPRPKEEGGRFPVAFGRFASINAPNAAGPCCPGFDSCNSPVSLTFREDKKRVQVTYAALHERVARLAKAVRDLGIKPGDRGGDAGGRLCQNHTGRRFSRFSRLTMRQPYHKRLWCPHQPEELYFLLLHVLCLLLCGISYFRCCVAQVENQHLYQRPGRNGSPNFDSRVLKSLERRRAFLPQGRAEPKGPHPIFDHP